MNNMKEEVERPRKLALYARINSNDWYCVFEVRYSSFDARWQPLPEGETREEPMPGYVRVTEPVAIEFTPIADDEIVQNAISSLDEEERKAIQELNSKIANIRERKNQLLALTHQPEVA